MADLGDGIFKGTILGMIFGIPVLIGIGILAIPFAVISLITGVPIGIIIQNLLVFVIAVFFVWLFSRFQIIENVIAGLVAGAAVYLCFKWHPLVCILIGAMTIGFLIFISHIMIGFWIKTIIFSVIVTFMVFMFLYSDAGLFPMSDKIWKIAFGIIFFLENILLRCKVAYNKGFLFKKKRESQTENHYGIEKNQIEFATAQPVYNENQANNSTISEINNLVRKMNAEISGKQVDEEAAYLMDWVYLFSQKNLLGWKINQ